MKALIAKTIVSLNMLNEKIEEFEIRNAVNYVYLFMNDNTLKTLGAELKDICNIPDESHSCCIYRGNKVYINNDLDFGEVEIR